MEFTNFTDVNISQPGLDPKILKEQRDSFKTLYEDISREIKTKNMEMKLVEEKMKTNEIKM